MNYRVFLDSASKPFLANFQQTPNLRPRVGDIVKIGRFPNQYKITTQTPSNPSENPPETIDFFVKLLNSSIDTITMGGDIARLTRTMRHLGR